MHLPTPGPVPLFCNRVFENVTKLEFEGEPSAWVFQNSSYNHTFLCMGAKREFVVLKPCEDRGRYG